MIDSCTEFISDVEKVEISEAITQCKGKLGLVAMKTNLSLYSLKKILKANSDLQTKADHTKDTYDEAFKNISDLHLKLGLLSGESWALSQVFNSSSPTANYLKAVKTQVHKGKSIKNEVGDDNEYHEEYDHVAYSILSSSPFTTTAHLCEAFSCSNEQLTKWITSNASFATSVSRGLSEGESKARNMLLLAAFEPQAKVNTALLKVLASNVYKIEEEPQAVVVNNNIASATESVEEMLKRRGIPIPETGGFDLTEISA